MKKIGFYISQNLAQPKVKLVVGLSVLVAMAIFMFVTGDWKALIAGGIGQPDFPPPWVW